MRDPVSITELLLQDLKGDAKVAELQVGLFWTAVVLNTTPFVCGLASTVRGDCSQTDHAVAGPDDLLKRSGCELASLLRSHRPVEASIGMAALNALLAMGTGGDYPQINARELILREGSGKRVAIIGHFPFVEDVRAAASHCWVLELKPKPGDLPADRAAMLLPDADVVAITSTSIINHTFEELIELCRPDAFVIVLGGSTPLSPVLFDFNVDVAAGIAVRDVRAVVRAVTHGATFRQIPGKQLVAIARPGLGRLAARLQEE
jgi:uncharacterized protein (DUF4213/DUF364 family)